MLTPARVRKFAAALLGGTVCLLLSAGRLSAQAATPEPPKATSWVYGVIRVIWQPQTGRLSLKSLFHWRHTPHLDSRKSYLDWPQPCAYVWTYV
jgi:hypothetical protein